MRDADLLDLAHWLEMKIILLQSVESLVQGEQVGQPKRLIL